MFNYNKDLNPMFDRYFPCQRSEKYLLHSKQESVKVRSKKRSFDYLFNYYLPDALGDLRTIKIQKLFIPSSILL